MPGLVQPLNAFTTDCIHSPPANDEVRLVSDLPAAIKMMPQEVAILHAYLSLEIEALIATAEDTDQEVTS